MNDLVWKMWLIANNIDPDYRDKGFDAFLADLNSERR